MIFDEGKNGQEKRRKEGQIATRMGQSAGGDFTGLSKFGDKFLNSFQGGCGQHAAVPLVCLRVVVNAWLSAAAVSFSDNAELRDLILVDTPGVMPGQFEKVGCSGAPSRVTRALTAVPLVAERLRLHQDLSLVRQALRPRRAALRCPQAGEFAAFVLPPHAVA